MLGPEAEASAAFCCWCWSGTHLRPTALYDPRHSTHHIPDRQTFSSAQRPAIWYSVLPANHLSSSSLWLPPCSVMLGSQTLGANRIDIHWNASGSWACLFPSSLCLAGHWQHT